MRPFFLFLILSTLFISREFPAAFVQDDHGCCCWKSERNSRYLWLGGAALLGAGTGALAGYAAGHRSRHTKEKTYSVIDMANKSSPLEIYIENISAMNAGDVVCSFEVINPAGHVLAKGKDQRTPGKNLLFSLDAKSEKLIGNYQVVLLIEEIHLPDDVSFVLFDAILLSNGEREKEMTSSLSGSHPWKVGDVVLCNGTFTAATIEQKESGSSQKG